MTELVRADHFAAALATVAKVNDLGPRLIDAERLGWREQAKIIEEAESLQAAVSAASEAIAAAERPATTREIAVTLGRLLKAFPNAGKADVETFGELLVGDVIDARPSIAAVVQGCTKLRRTAKFLPVIAEVLDALREVDDGIRAAKLRLEAMPARVVELKRAVEEGRRI
jgi:hypothetical protein